VTRQIPLAENLPWDFISGTSRKLLEKEFRAAFPLDGGN
jgi:hypothetical protein